MLEAASQTPQTVHVPSASPVQWLQAAGCVIFIVSAQHSYQQLLFLCHSGSKQRAKSEKTGLDNEISKTSQLASVADQQLCYGQLRFVADIRGGCLQTGNPHHSCPRKDCFCYCCTDSVLTSGPNSTLGTVAGRVPCPLRMRFQFSAIPHCPANQDAVVGGLMRPGQTVSDLSVSIHTFIEHDYDVNWLWAMGTCNSLRLATCHFCSRCTAVIVLPDWADRLWAWPQYCLVVVEYCCKLLILGLDYTIIMIMSL